MTPADPPPPADDPPAPRTVVTAWPLLPRRWDTLAPDFRDFLAPLLAGRETVELRAPGYRDDGGRRRNLAFRFGGPDAPLAFAAAALKAAGRCPGVYLVLNDVPPGDGGTSRAAEVAAADADIVRRRWLPVDVDPVRPPGVSATAAEKAAAYRTAVAVRDALAARGWPPPLVADSGNGYHLLYRLDLPNDADATRLVRGVLRALAAAHDSPEAAVDTRVFNAARVMKVPGTPACKGPNTAARPHRTGGWLDTPADVATVPRPLLEALAADAPPDPSAGGAAAATAATPAGPSLSDDDVLRLCGRFYRDKFARLWAGDTGGHGDDHSRADLALAGYLAWVAGPDEDRVVALFRRSGLYRAKWDSKHAADGRSYGRMTVGKAIAGLNGFYTGRPAARPARPGTGERRRTGPRSRRPTGRTRTGNRPPRPCRCRRTTRTASPAPSRTAAGTRTGRPSSARTGASGTGTTGWRTRSSPTRTCGPT